jgi:glycosyltransferase involved in cell wall biosynthesis
MRGSPSIGSKGAETDQGLDWNSYCRKQNAMRIGYVTTYDASDVREWSGLGYFIAKALENQSIDVVPIGPLTEYCDSTLRVKHFFARYVTRKGWLKEREPRVLQSYADQVASRLKTLAVDVVFSPGTIPISYLECNLPIAFWTDATFAGMTNFYPGRSNLSKGSQRNGNSMEQAALSRSRLAIYSSDWAAKTAKDNYQVDDRKVKVVPFGPNISRQQNLEDVRRSIGQRPTNCCNLLFVGVDWYRKGGDIAVEIARDLNQRGLKTQLTIVGCTPADELPAFVSTKGFLSKTNQAKRARLDQLFAESHFVILPTRADCVPVVIAEANSFGVPVVASNVGGIPTVVDHGVNGAMFSTQNFGGQASDFIFSAMNDAMTYRQLAECALGQYEDRLNWNVAGKKVKQLLEDHCS